MEKPKFSTESLKLGKSQSILTKAKNVKTISNSIDADGSEHEIEKYPKLKSETTSFHKTQARQKEVDNALNTKSENVRNLGVPLRQEFLNKKRELQNATTNLLQKYETRKIQGNLLNDDTYSIESEELLPLTLHLEVLPLEKNQEPKTKPKNCLDSNKSLNFYEQHLVNIFYTKVEGHPNGFYAENLPDWYKNTFDKNLPNNWLELIETSNRFYIEKMQNKTILYTKDASDEVDLNAAGDNELKIGLESSLKEKGDHHIKSSVGLEGNKYEQKRFQDNSKKTYPNKSNVKPIKSSDKINKKSSNKK